MANVTPEYCADIIAKFEPSDENKQRGVMGIEGKFFQFHLILFFVCIFVFVSLTIPLSTLFVSSSSAVFVS